MREIKFRVWDVERKSWMNEQDVYNEVQEQGRWNPERGQFYKLMQFTGLRDKNGKEIYEGDILQYTDNFNRPITGVVQYLGNGFWIEEKDETHYMPNDREVIGNIYENPELIGGTQKEEK